MTVRFVPGSSGMLASQIRNGAPYDVYLSANKELVDQLADSGHILPPSVRTFATGRLALWSKSTQFDTIRHLSSFAKRTVAIANPTHAPYGLAARQALMKSGLWDQLAGSIIYAENVRQALQFAESGNASAAIVAWSLVLDRNATLIPEDLHSPILQSGGAVSSTRYRHQASNFLDLLLSPPGQALLAKFGYGPATPATSKKR